MTTTSDSQTMTIPTDPAALAALRAAHPTRTIEGELEVVAIPGTRNIIEIGGGALRVV